MRYIIVAAAAALATGCFGGLKNEVPAPRIYRVDAPDVGRRNALGADLSVVVERTAPGLDGEGIAGRWPGKRLDYIADARWADDVLADAPVGAGRDASRNPAGCAPCRATRADSRATHTLVSRCAASRPITRPARCRSRRSRWP